MKSAVAILALAGCLSVPRTVAPTCKVDSDCNQAAGEVCQEGVCWGDPPAGMFAATLGPPSSRTDLVSTEIASLAIPPDGWLGAVPLEAPVTLSGRVDLFCPQPGTGCGDGSSLSASITVSRPSRIPGGPAFHASVTSKAGVAGRSNSFSINVPRSLAGDAPYVVTIVPDGRALTPPSDGQPSAAELAPPVRLTTLATDDVVLPIALGSASSPVMSGIVTDDSGHPLKNYRVAAMGRWDATSAMTEVSTVAYTTDGTFSITLADGLYGSIELVAKSYDANTIAPTLYITNLSPTSSTHTIAQPLGLGNQYPVTITVVGQSGNGEVNPVSGAVVTITGVYSQSIMAHTSTVLQTQATTGDDGTASVTLLDGYALGGSYLLRVVPPASSNLGVIFDQPFTLSQTEPIQLASRIELHGIVVDSHGTPIPNVSVTALPSLRFQWSLDPGADGPQSFLNSIPPATAVTPDDGDFVVWVDPQIAGVWGHYDLAFAPAMGSPEPNWTATDVEIPRVPGQGTYSLDNVTIPDASFVHGELTDPAGNPVEGGNFQVFQIASDTTVCGEVTNAPVPCVIPAQPLGGQGTSDSSGIVRLTLPRP